MYDDVRYRREPAPPPLPPFRPPVPSSESAQPEFPNGEGEYITPNPVDDEYITPNSSNDDYTAIIDDRSSGYLDLTSTYEAYLQPAPYAYENAAQ